MNNKNWRKLHRKIAPILFLPLLLSALTGIGYRIGRTWFNLPKENADWFLKIHQGEYLGEALVPIYILLVGLGLLGIIVSGLTMIDWQRLTKWNQTNPRQIHKILAPIAFIPLAVTALTGIMFRVGKDWLGMSKDTAAIFLRIHQGTYWGTSGRAFYVLIIGLALITLLITGLSLTGILPKKPKEKLSGDS